ncbi:hypothetical protein LOZ80_38095 [Paenibacillus sp. HWE-109]|uniref:hypothetical protein n=1 Tax=Paenibacillus sp. HWE-109 TaxID=1306526 RepID=UPI001EDFC1AD|nr:hypothetical protein [Paenibacillus sp. HWE-109]UKS27205.1 hypothetical protein LOZ80_38095 [Paenibacillus sp. HWE-109]
MATPGPVNRTLLQSYYQNAGDVYDDTKTEGAFGTLADQLDANYDYTSGLVAGGVLQPYPASLFRQALINGNFDVWQRGTSFNNAGASPTYTVDRFYIANAIDNNVKVLQSSSVPNKKSKFSARLEVMTATAGVSAYSTFAQKIEDYQFFAGQKVTLSGWIKCDSGAAVIPYLADGVGNYVAPAINSTQWTFFSYTAILNSSPTGISVILQFNRYGLAVGVGVNISQLQFNVGDSAPAFQPRSFAEELALCQRYYEKSYTYGTAPATSGATTGIQLFVLPSNTIAINQEYGTVSFKVQKRITPTVTIYPFTTTANAGRVSQENGTDLPTASGGTKFESERGFTVHNANGSALTTNLNAIVFHFASDAEL